jgi:hypothetical protein
LHPTIHHDSKLAVEDPGGQTYPAGGLVMKTWNFSVQDQMLIDALNFSKIQWSDYLMSLLIAARL